MSYLQSFADGEVVNEPKLYWRLFAPINDAMTKVSDDSGWAVPALQNSWVNYGGVYQTVGYRRVDGIVYLRGLIKGGAASTALPILTLPSGFTPEVRGIFSCLTGPTASLGRVDVMTSGQVLLYEFDLSGTNAYLDLSNIRFKAAA